MSSSEYCIYIPRVSGFYSREVVARVISQNIGKVERVDAINIPDENNRGMMDYDFHAFVYISEFRRDHFAQDVLSRLENDGTYDFLLETDESWFLIKHPPSTSHVQYDRTNAIALEELAMKCVCQDVAIAKQQQTIAALNSIVLNQTQEINRIQLAIYQILGRVYDQKTESTKIFSLYNSIMHGKGINNRWMLDEDDDGTEEYERAFMEESDAETERTRIAEEQKEEETEKSKSGPFTDASSSIPVTDRLKNTADLCGNN